MPSTTVLRFTRYLVVFFLRITRCLVVFRKIGLQQRFWGKSRGQVIWQVYLGFFRVQYIDVELYLFALVIFSYCMELNNASMKHLPAKNTAAVGLSVRACVGVC